MDQLSTLLSGEAYCDKNCEKVKAIEQEKFAEQQELTETLKSEESEAESYDYYEEEEIEIDYGDLDALYYEYYGSKEPTISTSITTSTEVDEEAVTISAAEK